MTLFLEQVAHAYAVVKTLGSELSFQEFQELYSQYHTEALKVQNSNTQFATCEAAQRPY